MEVKARKTGAGKGGGASEGIAAKDLRFFLSRRMRIRHKEASKGSVVLSGWACLLRRAKKERENFSQIRYSLKGIGFFKGGSLRENKTT